MGSGGERSRRDALVEANLHLVRPIANRLAKNLPSHFVIEDLVSAGQVGLLEAAKRFKPGDYGGVPFTVYARKWIRGAMIESVRGPRWLDAMRPALESVPEPIATPAPDADIDAAGVNWRLRRAVAALPARQRRLIQMHYEESQGLAAVGRVFGVGKSRASQLHLAAIRALRERLLRESDMLSTCRSLTVVFSESLRLTFSVCPTCPDKARI